MDWLNEMGVFARVVELNGFGKAAEALGMTRSAVSRQVTRLEAALGVKLLRRTTRAMSLTDAGQAVYTHCTLMLQAAHAARAAAASLVTTPRGLLRVSATVAFSHAWLLPRLPDLLAACPELQVDVVLLDRFVDLTEEGVDVVLRLTDTPPETLAARRLGDVRFVLCAAPDYLARHGEPQQPDELVHHNCVRQGFPTSQDLWHFEGPAGEQVCRVRGNAVVSGSEAVRQLLLAGLGCGILPDFAATQDLQAGRLHALLPGYAVRGPFSSLYALYLPSRQHDIKIRTFIDWLLMQIQRA